MYQSINYHNEHLLNGVKISWKFKSHQYNKILKKSQIQYLVLLWNSKGKKQKNGPTGGFNLLQCSFYKKICHFKGECSIDFIMRYTTNLKSRVKEKAEKKHFNCLSSWVPIEHKNMPGGHDSLLWNHESLFHMWFPVFCFWTLTVNREKVGGKSWGTNKAK